MEDLAGGVGEVMVEMGEKAGDGFRGVEASETVIAEQGIATGDGEMGGHLCFQETGQYRVDSDVAGAEFAGQGSGETEESGLGGGVGGLAGGGVAGGVAGDEDDMAGATVALATGGGLGAAEGTVKVHGELAVPGGLVGVGKQVVLGQPGLGHEEVRGFRRGEKFPDGIGVGDVEEVTAGGGDEVADGLEGGDEGAGEIALATGDEDAVHAGASVDGVRGRASETRGAGRLSGWGG